MDQALDLTLEEFIRDHLNPVFAVSMTFAQFADAFPISVGKNRRDASHVGVQRIRGSGRAARGRATQGRRAVLRVCRTKGVLRDNLFSPFSFTLTHSFRTVEQRTCLACSLSTTGFQHISVSWTCPTCMIFLENVHDRLHSVWITAPALQQSVNSVSVSVREATRDVPHLFQDVSQFVGH